MFIVYKNRTQIKFSYLIRRCTSQPIKAALITLLRSADIVAGNIDLVISFQSICLCPHYTQRHSVIENMIYSHSLLRLMVKPIVWFVVRVDDQKISESYSGQVDCRMSCTPYSHSTLR